MSAFRVRLYFGFPWTEQMAFRYLLIQEFRAICDSLGKEKQIGYSAFITELLVAGRSCGDRVSFAPRNGSFPDFYTIKHFITRHAFRGDILIALAAR